MMPKLPFVGAISLLQLTTLFHITARPNIPSAISLAPAVSCNPAFTSASSHPAFPVPVPGIGYLSSAYYVNWAIYGRQYDPKSLPADRLTHVFYAFANIRSDGEVYLSDTWADIERHFDGERWDNLGPSERAHGCINQIRHLKLRNRNLKVVLSIGGWTYSSNFVLPASTSAGRELFARSAVKLMHDIGFDGLEIDWEYPNDELQASNLVSLLQQLRSELDRNSRLYNNTPYLLTAASPAGPAKYSVLHLAEMDRYLDYWNLMCYDYAGSWDQTSGHAANLYASPDKPETTRFNTDQAVSAYLSVGIPAQKIIIGMPLYGRAFGGTEGPGTSFTSIPAGHFERGVYDYKDLPLSNRSVIQEDSQLGASWSYDGAQRVMVSFDTRNIVKLKAQYIRNKGLGGGVFWEASGDGSGENSLISAFLSAIGGKTVLQQSPNHILYPDSRYENIRSVPSTLEDS